MPPPKENHIRQRLLEIFSLVNMDSLPAMTEHVGELISLLGNNRSTAHELADAILKDFSLTTKILQVVNSAYYSRGTPISSISRAVTVVGFDTLRQLATTMALFEQFVNAGAEKDEIAGVFTTSLLSATQSRIYCELKKIHISPEEAFICTMLHRLGKIVVLVYLPDLYHAINDRIRQGYSEEHSCRNVLHGLTYSQVGQEIATYWNFSKRIVSCMGTEPVKPGKSQDSFLLLHNVVVFSNNLTSAYFEGTAVDMAELIFQFGSILSIGKDESLELVQRSIAICENLSGAMRGGLSRIGKKRSDEITVSKDHSGRWTRLT